MTKRFAVVIYIFAAMSCGVPPPGSAWAQNPAASTSRQLHPRAYDSQLVRLSHLLGAIHYLQHLCEPASAESWRRQMEVFLAAEQPDETRRGRLIGAFNQGYYNYSAVHRNCTPNTRAIIRLYMEEGVRLIRTVTARFGQ